MLNRMYNESTRGWLTCGHGKKSNESMHQRVSRLSVDIWSTYRPTIGRYLGRYSGRHSAHTLTVDYRRNIGRLSVVYRSNVKSLDCHCQMESYTHFILFQRPEKRNWKRNQAKVKFPPPGRLCKSNSPLRSQRGGGVEVSIELCISLHWQSGR